MTDDNLSLQPRKHEISIEYCVPCDYSAQALRVADELVRNYQHVIDRLILKMGSQGTFEVEVDGQTLFSKQATQRHPQPEEVLNLFRELVGSGVQMYHRG